MGEQSDNEHQITEVEKAEHNSGKNTDQGTKDIYPGVSSQQRLRIRAEQLFKEGQGNKAIQNKQAFKQKLQNKANKELKTVEEGDNKRQTVDGQVEDKKLILTCIDSVGHEVDRINRDTKKRSNKEQAEKPHKTAKSSQI
eukprot:11840969-Heterocapsa_arctica.AAC.1